MIRIATPQDHETIVTFNLALARETEDTVLDRERLAEGVRRFLADPTLGRYYLAIDRVGDGKPVRGQMMVTYEFSDWRNGLIWWIQSVYIATASRRQGVYRALHAHVRDQAREAGAVGLRLAVDRDNAAARRTYEAMGMRASRYDMYEDLWV